MDEVINTSSFLKQKYSSYHIEKVRWLNQCYFLLVVSELIIISPTKKKSIKDFQINNEIGT